MRRLPVVFCLLALALSPAALHAQFSLGFQGGWSTRTDWGIGGRATMDLSPKGTPVAIYGTYDYFWPGGTTLVEGEYWEFNLNLAFVQGIYRPEAQSYLAVGLNVANIRDTRRADGEVLVDETKYGVNLVGGSKYKLGRIAPFFEVRYTIKGSRQFYLTAGLDLVLNPDWY